MSVHFVHPSGRHVVWPHKVFYRPVGDQPVERSIPLSGDCPVVVQVNVKTVAAAVADLLWVDRNADPDGPAVPDPLEERSVSTANIQQPPARPILRLIQQIVVLIRLSLLERQLWVAVVNPLGQVKQAAGREEPIDHRIAGYNRYPRPYIRRPGIVRYSGTRYDPRPYIRRPGIVRYSGTRYVHRIFTQLLMSVRNATSPNV